MNKTKTTPTETTTETAIAAAEAALSEAREKLAGARKEADQAARHAADVQARLVAGDSALSTDDLIAAEPEARRLAAVAAAHERFLPIAEQRLRVAKTNHLVHKLEAGAVLNASQLEDLKEANVTDLVTVLAPLVTTLQDNLSARAEITGQLADTTAYGDSFKFRGGDRNSPLQVEGFGSAFTANGADYPSYAVANVIRTVLHKAELALLASL